MKNRSPSDRAIATSHAGRTVLGEIIAGAQQRVATLYAETSVHALLQRGRGFPRRSLVAAIRRQRPAVIAEIKKASPSKGLLGGRGFDPLRLAEAFAAGGAAALSVVTEPQFFRGDGNWIGAVREQVSLPILRKDFIIDPIQVAQSAALGADAILLIARILSDAQLSTLSAASQQANLEILYEAHDESDLQKIVRLQPQLVGINARNLEDFSVDTRIFARLYEQIPTSALAVAESGIHAPQLVRELVSTGYRGFLIGESLLRSPDPAAMIRTFRQEGPNSAS